MPTEIENNGSAPETGDPEQQGQQSAPTPETGGNGETPPASTEPSEPIQLPEDHPLVKTLAAQKATLAAQKTELAELKQKSEQLTQLEQDLQARPTKEAYETLQTRSDRLEAFIQAVGGPLGRALDSKSFTTALFESDKDIADIVKDWNAANPTATSTALGSSAAAPAGGKPDMNTLLRKAAN
jgi:hypothetical protein